MKKSLIAFAAFAAAAFIALVGCETEKLSDTQLSISPSSATVAPGKSVALTATGGWDYTWRIAQGKGTLSSYNGKKVTYTASDVSYTPPSSSSSTTNSTPKGFVKAEEDATAVTISTTIIEVRSGDLTATATITVKE